MTDGHAFATLPVTPANHFRLHFYAAVSQLLAAAAPRAEASEPIAECVRALSGYDDELRACGVPPLDASQALDWWGRAISTWEDGADAFLPARALRHAIGVGLDDLILVFTAGLVEEDALFGALFERMNGAHGQNGQARATLAVLAECRRGSHRPDVRGPVRALTDCGLVRVLNTDAPRAQHAIEVPTAIWDVLRGDRHERPAPGFAMRRRRPSSRWPNRSCRRRSPAC
jgi:hypothetical protein